MGRIRLTLFCWLLGASSARAQTSTPTPAPPVFGAETNLIHVDVVVTDKQGRQITSLEAVDFEIQAKGQKFPAVVATYVPLVDEAPATAARARDGLKLRAEEVRRVITFIVARPVIETGGGSNIEANMLIARRVDHMLKRFIEVEVKSRDLVAIVNADSRKPLLNQFTASPAALSMAMDLLRKEWHNPDVPPLVLFPGSLEPLARYASEVIELAEAIIKRQQDVPGRKLLFMVSGALSLGGPMSTDFLHVRQEIETLVEHANRAGVTIYGISPGGLGSGYPEGLDLLSEGTGGTTIGNTELLGDNLAKVMELNRGYYLLGYDAGDAPKGLPRSVKVRVRREGAKVAARPQAYLDGAFASGRGSMSSNLTLEGLLNSPLAASGIGVRITPYITWTGPKSGDFQAVIDIDPKDLDLASEPGAEPSFDLDVLTRIVDQRGAVLKADRLALKSRLKDGGRREIRFMVKAPLAGPGFYQADVSVQDRRSGKFGNATALASLSDLNENKKTLAVTGLVLRPASQPSALPAESFAQGTSAAVSCRLAHAQRGKGSQEVRLQIQMRITRDGAQVRRLEPQTLEKSLPELIDINGRIELGDLEPGGYVAEVEITDLLGERGRNKATASARFNIVDTAR